MRKWLVIAAVFATGCDRSSTAVAPTDPVDSVATAHAPAAPAPPSSKGPRTPRPDSRHTGPVSDEFGPVIKGAPEPRRILCDPTVQYVQRRLERRDRVFVRAAGDFHYLVDVQNGPLGGPVEMLWYGVADGGEWVRADKSLMSLEDGTRADLGEYGGKLLGDAHHGWAFYEHAVLHTTDLQTGERTEKVVQARYAVVDDGEVNQFPLDKGFDPISLVARGDAVWGVVAGSDCALMRFGVDGKVSCEIASTDRWRPGGLTATGDRWLIGKSRDGTRIIDTEARKVLEFPGCADAKLAEYVADVPAVSVVCEESGQAGYWTPSSGFQFGGELEERPLAFGKPKARFVKLNSMIGSPLGDHSYRYLDAVRGEVIVSEHPLSEATRAGFLYLRDGEALNVETGEVHNLELPDCEARWKLVDSYGHHAILTCTQTAYGDVNDRDRPRKLTSCRSPVPPPERMLAILLVDLKHGQWFEMNDAKPLVLSDGGVVAIRGSGHSLDERDGTEVVFQPYPSPRPADPEKSPANDGTKRGGEE